jgi:hypothetical protein
LYALGGGFGDNDGGNQDKLNIVTSSPVQIDPKTLEITYSPIEGDTAGSFVPNGWLVEGFYGGPEVPPDGIIVRPWVVCAEVAS